MHDISNDDTSQYKFKPFLTQNLPYRPKQQTHYHLYRNLVKFYNGVSGCKIVFSNTDITDMAKDLKHNDRK
jgi:hypothetical protein